VKKESRQRERQGSIHPPTEAGETQATVHLALRVLSVLQASTKSAKTHVPSAEGFLEEHTGALTRDYEF
jgi:hypothetical protein